MNEWIHTILLFILIWNNLFHSKLFIWMINSHLSINNNRIININKNKDCSEWYKYVIMKYFMEISIFKSNCFIIHLLQCIKFENYKE